MTEVTDIAELIAEHARCWQAVGWSQASPFYDPGLPSLKQEALEATKALSDAAASLQQAIRMKEYDYQKLRAAMVRIATLGEKVEEEYVEAREHEIYQMISNARDALAALRSADQLNDHQS